MKNKIFFCYILVILVFFKGSNSCLAEVPGQISNYSRDLLTVLKWDLKYDQERKKDVEFLLGSIDGPLVQNLDNEQKAQAIASMRAAVLKKMIEDREQFKTYLLSQYNQFFTLDELEKLKAYFKTDLMQMIVQSQIDKKEVGIDEINHKLLSANGEDQEIIKWFRDSYLNARFIRFQENVNPRINKMIAERMQEVLALAIKQIPNLVGSMQLKQSINVDLNTVER